MTAVSDEAEGGGGFLSIICSQVHSSPRNIYKRFSKTGIVCFGLCVKLNPVQVPQNSWKSLTGPLLLVPLKTMSSTNLLCYFLYLLLVLCAPRCTFCHDEYLLILRVPSATTSNWNGNIQPSAPPASAMFDRVCQSLDISPLWCHKDLIRPVGHWLCTLRSTCFIFLKYLKGKKRLQTKG